VNGRIQNPENREQRTENREQRTEDRGQRTIKRSTPNTKDHPKKNPVNLVNLV
jgi:hypothetical protein